MWRRNASFLVNHSLVSQRCRHGTRANFHTHMWLYCSSCTVPALCYNDSAVYCGWLGWFLSRGSGLNTSIWDAANSAELQVLPAAVLPLMCDSPLWLCCSALLDSYSSLPERQTALEKRRAKLHALQCCANGCDVRDTQSREVTNAERKIQDIKWVRGRTVL